MTVKTTSVRMPWGSHVLLASGSRGRDFLALFGDTDFDAEDASEAAFAGISGNSVEQAPQREYLTMLRNLLQQASARIDIRADGAPPVVVLLDGDRAVAARWHPDAIEWIVSAAPAVEEIVVATIDVAAGPVRMTGWRGSEPFADVEISATGWRVTAGQETLVRLQDAARRGRPALLGQLVAELVR